VARAEGVLRGVHDLGEVLRRLTAFSEVGADCLYAPGLRDAAQFAAVVKAVAPKPVNGLIGGDLGLRADDLALERVEIRLDRKGDSQRLSDVIHHDGWSGG